MNTEKLNFMYIRVASKEANKDLGQNTVTNGILMQRELLNQYRHAHPTLPAEFEEVVDDGYSGIGEAAPGLKKILDLVEQNKVACIIVTDISRLSRNPVIASTYLEDKFPAHGIRFISVKDNYDSAIDSLRDTFYPAVFTSMTDAEFAALDLIPDFE